MEGIGPKLKMADYTPQHVSWSVSDRVATLVLRRPERKNALTFDTYQELSRLFRMLPYATDVRAVVLFGAEGNFSSGGDVHEIIGPLTQMSMDQLLAFTRLTGEVIRGMLQCPQVIVSAVDGVCVGAGAALAAASDYRLGTTRSRVAFLFTRVGLAGCDMGASAILPRIVGLGRAAELLLTGRFMGGEEAFSWGFFNELCEPEELLERAQGFARELSHGPTFALAMTKRMLYQEWNMALDVAIEAEAQAQAICMSTKDFRRAYEAFVTKEKPVFEGD
ncbi:enoyl-CoA hydratase family protein [uncultured Thermus sp.]|uniref:enoyl-CoA hydratase family protein n=1 Tax=uncultured Thermus sp. TaxID=157149 RepID=UPI00262CAA0D|nr:enoyl-CoA hydratase family protein [uncultured Thermus sp.]